MNENGESKRIMHTGVKYSEKTQSQVPTIIVRSASVSDSIIPVDNVYYESGKYGGWKEEGVFPETLSDASLGSEAGLRKLRVGKKFRSYLL